MITSTISYLELAWTIVVVLGIIFAIPRVIAVIGDVWARERLGKNGLLLDQARNDVRTELFRLCILIGLLGIAYIALSRPNPPFIWRWETFWSAGVFISIPCLFAYDSLRSQQLRNRILNRLEDDKPL